MAAQAEEKLDWAYWAVDGTIATSLRVSWSGVRRTDAQYHDMVCRYAIWEFCYQAMTVLTHGYDATRGQVERKSPGISLRIFRDESYGILDRNYSTEATGPPGTDARPVVQEIRKLVFKKMDTFTVNTPCMNFENKSDTGRLDDFTAKFDFSFCPAYFASDDL
eukprot:186550-Rhodomonas_salina.1